MKKLLFIDRDGVLIEEPPVDFQVDSFEKLTFVPGVLSGLGKIARELDFELVMVTNQDGLGTDAYPEADFRGPHDLMVRTLAGEGIVFTEQCIDRTFPHENAPTRKPGTAMLTNYMNGDYDLANSFVIGDRLTDMELAKNLGCRGIYMRNAQDPGKAEVKAEETAVLKVVALETRNWEEIYAFLKLGDRTAKVKRTTKETDIDIELNLDGTGKCTIDTGLKFFDHMLEQIARHGALDMKIVVKGDLEVDEHHTMEDTAIALGECFHQALGAKLGLERYGFFLPMDDCTAKVGIDFGGRNWLVWKAKFTRERIGDVPTEMFMHFFKSFTDSARCNLFVKATGENEHHKIESIFKAFAKAIKMAKSRNANDAFLPSTKGIL
ncbi:MAG: bifunctional histidinol-phosphatase/imidazoleglycerol-phosphate dehydratase HisB [Crocinitomicaceae bacterium]|nr:bifunctional histidinol-phosphatase/imidazoleglycerol-phosphate dehydratase HisB [Crocinitomicaceae bacterium]